MMGGTRRERFCRRPLGAAAAVLALWLGQAAAAPDGREISGTWLTDDGRAVVEIARCGEGRCGSIVWLPEALKGAVDALNPSLGLRSRKICGLRILSDLKRQADGSWDDGTVYDPEDGKTYSVAVDLDGGDRLKVTGYIGVKLLGETHVWSRVGPGLKRCAGALVR